MNVTLTPRARVRHVESGRLGVVQDGGSQNWRLVAWDDGDTEYARTDQLERSDEPKPERVDAGDAPVFITDAAGEAPTIIFDPPVEPPETAEPEPAPSVAPAEESGQAAVGASADPGPALEADGEPGPPQAPHAAKRKWSREECLQAIRDWYREHGRPPTQADWDPAIAKAQGRPERAERFRAAGGKWPAAHVVKTACGGWGAAIRAAGLATAPTGLPATPTAKATPKSTPNGKPSVKPVRVPAAAKPTPPAPPTQVQAATGIVARLLEGVTGDQVRVEIARLEEELALTRAFLELLERAAS